MFVKRRTTPDSAPLAVDLTGRATARVLEVAGTSVHYWDYAPAEPADSRVRESVAHTRTVVLVHGFRGDHHGLERVVELLPEYRIVMADLPGFGASPAFAHGKHDIAGYAAFLEGFLTLLKLGPETVLLGHSFGSIVASHFVASNPGRVHSLILINPIAAPALEGPKGIMTKLAVFYYWAAAKLPYPMGNALLRNRLIVYLMSITMAKTREPELLAFIHGQHYAYFSNFANRDMLLEAFQASVSGTVREVAAKLTLPTLLIAGELDDIATLPTQHTLTTLLPRAELHVIEQVGHLIHYETPAPASAAIISFLERHPAP